MLRNDTVISIYINVGVIPNIYNTDTLLSCKMPDTSWPLTEKENIKKTDDLSELHGQLRADWHLNPMYTYWQKHLIEGVTIFPLDILLWI